MSLSGSGSTGEQAGLRRETLRCGKGDTGTIEETMMGSELLTGSMGVSETTIDSASQDSCLRGHAASRSLCALRTRSESQHLAQMCKTVTLFPLYVLE